MKPNTRAIHPGADDNASGDAAVLAIAQRLRDQLSDVKNRRTTIVALFSGEEVGLAGSSWLVAHPPLPTLRTVAMVNLDMVGMMRDNRLIVFGTDSAPQWHDLVAHAAEFARIAVTASGDGYGPSDQTSFYAKQIPVIHLFTGAHERYQLLQLHGCAEYRFARAQWESAPGSTSSTSARMTSRGTTRTATVT